MKCISGKVLYKDNYSIYEFEYAYEVLVFILLQII